jgi:hypothetical protein
MNRSAKRLLFIITFAVLCLCVIEFLCFVFFTSFRSRFTFYDLRRYVVKETDIDLLPDSYDMELGWDSSYETDFGERPRAVSYDDPLIATFGDSYTHCTDVRHDETWQTYLSALLEADVYNFGTGGFGTDQAFLKFKSVYPRLKTQIVVLGVVTENINRIVNVYRPFYFPKTGILLPKPRFRLIRDRLVLIENPIRGTEEIERLRDIRFIQKMGENDWWYNRDNFPVFGFPYVKILFNKRMWLEAFYGKTNREISDIDPRPWENLWKQQHATDLMFKIIDAFIQSVESYDALPVIMILPMQDQVYRAVCTGENPLGVAMISDYCKRRNCLCFNAVDALARNVGKTEEITQLFIVHVSAKGNRIIAEEMFDFISANIELPHVR